MRILNKNLFYKSSLVLLFGCMLTIASAQQNTTIKKKHNTPVSPSETKKVDAYIRKQMSENHIPGMSIAVVRDGKVILAKGYGISNLELSTPVTENTAFAIYSITKTFTAIATMMLVEEGKVSLEDAITKHVADLPSAWNVITIRHLLTHTSGLPDLCEASPDPCETSIDYTQDQLIKMVANLPLKFAVGEKWEYSNTGYFLLGMVIEKVSGKSYEQFLQERIFSPLSMKNSRFENYTEVIPNRADGYTWKNGRYYNAFRVSPTLLFSVAGIVSTVLDLAKYDAALYTEKLLKKSTLEQMFTKGELNNGQTVDHGLGFGMSPFRGHRRVGHSGGHTGFATTITRLIDDEITVIILSNADSKGHTGNRVLINDIANEIASFYF
jgi:CubicO group peptidase (beta-lactamase class C family)